MVYFGLVIDRMSFTSKVETVEVRFGSDVRVSLEGRLQLKSWKDVLAQMLTGGSGRGFGGEASPEKLR